MLSSVLLKYLQQRRRVRGRMDALENFDMTGRTFKLVYYGNITLWGILVAFLVIFILLELVKDSADSQNLDSQVTAGPFKMMVPDMKEILLWGHHGRGVKVNVTGLFPDHSKEYEDGFQKYSLNKYLSDRISMRRPLPDVRDVECRRVTYNLSDLPKVSVVVVFRNEPRTTLLRMLYSVVDRSPPEIIADIILVDDGTETTDLQYPKLEHYLTGLKQVRIVRLAKPLGPAQARLQGARNATGDVLVFLQPRSECTEGWLLPLVRAVAADPSTVAVPLVDTIDYSTFQYSPTVLPDILVGSFTWDLGTRKTAPTKPVEDATLHIVNPVVSDGIFAVTQDNLLGLGGFDAGLILEHSVNIEFSFRTWLCGGQIVIVPCSHVGYIGPRSSPAGIFSKETIADSLRVADKWMGVYRYFVYERMLPTREDYLPKIIQTQKEDNASCQSFDWLLQTLEPAMAFTEEIHRRGQLVLSGLQKPVLILRAMGHKVFMQDLASESPTIWYFLKSGVLATENKTCLSFIPPGNTTDQLLDTKSDSLDVDNIILENPAFIHQQNIESQLQAAPAVGQQREPPTSKSLLSILTERERQRNPQRLKTQEGPHQLKPSLTDRESSLTGKKLSPRYDGQNSVNLRQNQLQDQKRFFETHVKSRSLQNSVLQYYSESRSLLSSTRSASQNNLFEHSEIDDVSSQQESEDQLEDSLLMKPCDAEADRWSYTEEQTLQHQTSGLCLEVHKDTSGNNLLRLVKCLDSGQGQQWSFVSGLMFI